ncbi:helix-turn-helix domain-containing protein [Paenibacillaceae bacterium WGS1546]|uniref:helix-turn-helix domain-containing protein n=1 Tax=Cohnella sp. WGS1546 TaxID=3366810 RepID=UPI00372D4B55
MAMMPRKDDDLEPVAEEPRFTVNEVLTIPLMQEARFIAGGRGAWRPIANVSFAAVDEAFETAGPGDLLIVPGHPSLNEPAWLRSFLAELARRGVAAVGVKTGLGFERMKPEAAAEAEKAGMPLLALPGGIDIAELSAFVAERISSPGKSLLGELNARVRRMTRLLLEGSGLQAFLDELEAVLGNPVAVVREGDETWLSRTLREVEPAESWALLQSLTYRLVGRAANGGSVPLTNGCRIYARPVPARKFKQAALAVVQTKRELKLLDKLSIDRLAALVGMELANVEAVREVEGKYLDRFLQDWLSGKIVSEADWKLRAEVCGCAVPENSPMCALLVGLQDGNAPEKLRELSRRLRSEKLRSAEGLLASPVGEDLALLVPLPPEAAADSGGGPALFRLLEPLLAELRTVLGEPDLRLYAGRVVHRPDGLQGSWAQARRARQVADICGLNGDIVPYDKLGVYSLLYLIPAGEEREQFLNRYSLPIQLADRKGGGRLMETLEMFFRCNGNIKLTSEKLYAHYNTIVYRLDKIQNILGVSLDDPEDRLQLHLALKLGRITPGSSV